MHGQHAGSAPQQRNPSWLVEVGARDVQHRVALPLVAFEQVVRKLSTGDGNRDLGRAGLDATAMRGGDHEPSTPVAHGNGERIGGFRCA